MTQPLKAVQVSEHVYWVGAIDWAIRDFHGYSTEQGTTYNAYLILGDKVTLVDTVKPAFVDELMSRISSVIDPSRIDYIISNHSEMDHSGSLPAVVDRVRPERVFASPMGVKALADHFQLNAPVASVKDGESISLGNLSVGFTETRMVHWPDSMFSFLLDDGVLFSNDAFGMHLATSQRFDDEVSGWEYQAAKYYANILMPLSLVIAKTLAKVEALKLPIKVIAPDHGFIWRKDLETIVSLYSRWSAQKRNTSAVVVYDTMWGSTATMATAISEGLSSEGVRNKLMPLKGCNRSEVITELLEAGAVVVGAPTMNNNIFPPMADLLTYLKGLKPRNLIGAAFGSYGWSGEAVGQIREYLSAAGVEMPLEGLKVKFVPREQDLADCFQMGSSLARILKEAAAIDLSAPAATTREAPIPR